MLKQKGITLIEQATAVALVTLTIIGFFQVFSKTADSASDEMMAADVARLEVKFAGALYEYLQVHNILTVSDTITFETLRDEGYLPPGFGEGEGKTPLGQKLVGIVGVKEGIKMSYGVVNTGAIPDEVIAAYNLESSQKKEAFAAKVAVYIMEMDKENRIIPVIKDDKLELRFALGDTTDPILDYFPNHTATLTKEYEAPAFFVLQKSPGYLVFNHVVSSGRTGTDPYSYKVTYTGYSSFCPKDAIVPIEASPSIYWNKDGTNYRNMYTRSGPNEFGNYDSKYNYRWLVRATDIGQFCIPASEEESKKITIKPQYVMSQYANTTSTVVLNRGYYTGAYDYIYNHELTFRISGRNYTLYASASWLRLASYHGIKHWLGISNGVRGDATEKRTLIYVPEFTAGDSKYFGPYPWYKKVEVLL